MAAGARRKLFPSRGAVVFLVGLLAGYAGHDFVDESRTTRRAFPETSGLPGIPQVEPADGERCRSSRGNAGRGEPSSRPKDTNLASWEAPERLRGTADARATLGDSRADGANRSLVNEGGGYVVTRVAGDPDPDLMAEWEGQANPPTGEPDEGELQNEYLYDGLPDIGELEASEIPEGDTDPLASSDLNPPIAAEEEPVPPGY